ncbi:hypothetical protein ZIOFF_071848 [Zingiber officinale]|uniref:Methyltransferase domain-containing protein n=1 Tax=Zingiber officinale TaxID=94328 RepID=A0A8J5C1W4_ZINOF|nr:hypothetical protein ZIOFF_071848 [Zingiber officinale]
MLSVFLYAELVATEEEPFEGTICLLERQLDLEERWKHYVVPPALNSSFGDLDGFMHSVVFLFSIVPPVARKGREVRAAEEGYEWFKYYSHFQHLIRPFLNPPRSVLEIGCGKPRLCKELHKDGVADMTCVDISPVAVERMRSRFRDEGHEGDESE